ncbi:trypsin-like peptidase domain-containing protein [Bradyrhizobium sp. CW4]|uniref:trypsin-like serine peptidase n=1 Tax=Bradyrhizobium sp. CW4 TaxID=2782687 RepID=UPI001FF80B1D|nr:serine protease [Bradyrhizobium sp. CW4]MCK1413569.1 trypsin-like peptidase domain-containing protein [Bradyrhizobium sp. CW4]
MPRLTAEQAEELVQVLSATLSEDNIAVYLGLATGDNLYNEYVGQGCPKNKILRALVQSLDEQGTLILFLRVVYKRRPHNDDVLSYLSQHFPGSEAPPTEGPILDVQKGGVRVENASKNAAAPGLQRYVRKDLGDVDMLDWIARGQQIARRVCRIERDRNALGTGFLVGANLVLTNWHVIRHALPANNTDDLACRFDFAVNPGGGTQNGEEIDVTPSGIITFKPCSVAELTPKPDEPPPQPGELDYALLRLSKPAGSDRGWFDLTRDGTKLLPGAPLLIAQHPAAAPLKLAMDTEAIIGEKFSGLRLRYRTNTDHGSSGSPCLGMNWSLVALHHLGDPALGTPVFNQGIPISLIRDSIKAAGHGDLLLPPP